MAVQGMHDTSGAALAAATVLERPTPCAASGFSQLRELLALEPHQLARPVALHLFSGPTSREDGIRELLWEKGWWCIDVDTVNDAVDNLANDLVWEMVFQAINSGLISLVWMGPPCTSFSPARRHGPGPRAVRSATFPRGLPRAQLSDAEAEEVRRGNYYALQCVAAAALAAAANVMWAIENPEPWNSDESASMFDFTEFEALAATTGARTVDFDQCMHGAETVKPTRVLYWGFDLAGLWARCNHQPRWIWCEGKDASGRTIQESRWLSHPPLIKMRRPDGQWASKAAAAYPAGLNAAIAEAAHTSPLWGRYRSPPSHL